jgi:acyl-CoA thioesterase FadM
MGRINSDLFSIDQQLESNFFFLMFGRHWTFQPTLYNRAAVEFPMIFRTRISGVGRSSIDISQTLEDEADGTELASLAFRLVNIDPVTRGSAVPIPDEIRKEGLKLVSPGSGKFPKIDVPTALVKDTFSCRIRVRYDDMDMLFHTNQGSYLGYALECAARAAESGFYSLIREDVAFWRARRATGIHLMESHAGDELDVSTWQDAENQLLLHFAISKSGQIAYYAQIEYYSK